VIFSDFIGKMHWST